MGFKRKEAIQEPMTVQREEQPNVNELQDLRDIITQVINDSINPVKYSCTYCGRLRNTERDTLCNPCDRTFPDPRDLEIYQLSKRVGWPRFQADPFILKRVPENHADLTDDELKEYYHEHDAAGGFIGYLAKSEQPVRRMNVSDGTGTEWYDRHYPDVFHPDGPQVRRSEVPGTSTPRERETHVNAVLTANANRQAEQHRESAQRELERVRARAAELEKLLNVPAI